MTITQRFLSKVKKTPTCWLWLATKGRTGYGQFTVNCRHVYAHRWSYQHFIKPIPLGYDIDHVCRVRSCVRPSHLEAVTRQENIRRSTCLITHCPQWHEYTRDNTYVWIDNSRRCRACDRKRSLQRYYDRRARHNALKH